jgi:hypothetical protein
MDEHLTALLKMGHPLALLDSGRVVESYTRITSKCRSIDVGTWFGVALNKARLHIDGAGVPTKLVFLLVHPQNELQQCTPAYRRYATISDMVCSAVAVWTGTCTQLGVYVMLIGNRYCCGL